MVQLIEYWTDRFPEVDALLDEWITGTHGQRTAERTRIGVDRHDSSHHIEIIEFRSAADADRNSALPGHPRNPSEVRSPVHTGTALHRPIDLPRYPALVL